MTRHDNAVYLHHRLDAVEKITHYIGKLSHSEFIADSLRIDAVLRNFEIIGEASNNLSDDFKEQHATIDFRSAIGIRNRLIHGYDDVDLNIVWDTIKDDLPTLKQAIEKIL